MVHRGKTSTHIQTMNFKTLVAPVAVLTLAIGGVVSTSDVKAESYTTNRIGDSTYTYGSDGSNFNTNSIGGTTFYNGRTRDGESYSGSCTTIGSTTFCN